MSGQHTQGKIEAFTEPEFSGWWALREKTDDGINHELGSGDGGLFEPDARRLAACWNAFENYKTEYIEKCRVVELSSFANSNIVCAKAVEVRMAQEPKELAAARARIAELDAQIGKRPCQNSRCNELNSARALLQEVLDGTQPFISALECECDFDGEKWAEKVRSFLEGK